MKHLLSTERPNKIFCNHWHDGDERTDQIQEITCILCQQKYDLRQYEAFEILFHLAEEQAMYESFFLKRWNIPAATVRSLAKEKV